MALGKAGWRGALAVGLPVTAAIAISCGLSLPVVGEPLLTVPIGIDDEEEEVIPFVRGAVPLSKPADRRPRGTGVRQQLLRLDEHAIEQDDRQHIVLPGKLRQRVDAVGIFTAGHGLDLAILNTTAR